MNKGSRAGFRRITHTDRDDWEGAHGQRWAELRLGHQPAYHGQDEEWD